MLKLTLRQEAIDDLNDIWNYTKTQWSENQAEKYYQTIKFRMEQLGLTQTDLAEVFGQKSRASEILNRKRKLSLEMIRQLHSSWHIPTEVLVQAY